MSQRKVPLVLGESYHVLNRGNSKQTIFRDTSDYERFQSLLYVANSPRAFSFREVKKDAVFLFERDKLFVHIGAYCLMPNHFHILLKPVTENGVQLFMQKLATAYSMYFNYKYERSGALFEGKFKSEHANSDEYLKYLFSYIHLNPVKLIDPQWREKGIKNDGVAFKYLSEYTFSSFQDFYRGLASGSRVEKNILEISSFPDYFSLGDSHTFEKEILEWLQFNNHDNFPEARPRGKLYTEAQQ